MTPEERFALAEIRATLQAIARRARQQRTQSAAVLALTERVVARLVSRRRPC